MHESKTIPSINELTGMEALGYVTEMLCKLVETHERLLKGPHGRKMSGDRRPSMPESEKEARLVARTIAEGTPNETPFTTPEPDEGEQQDSRLHNRFWLKTVPKLSIHDYILRFDKYCRASPATYLATGRYIYEMSVVKRKMPVTRHNVYRIFAAAFANAAKVVEDVMYPYKRYATTGGLSTGDLSKLEISFAFLCDFEFKLDAGLLQDSLAQWVTI